MLKPRVSVFDEARLVPYSQNYVANQIHKYFWELTTNTSETSLRHTHITPLMRFVVSFSNTITVHLKLYFDRNSQQKNQSRLPNVEYSIPIHWWKNDDCVNIVIMSTAAITIQFYATSNNVEIAIHFRVIQAARW